MAVQNPMAGELWSDYLARTGYQDPQNDPTQPQAGSQWAIPQGSTYDFTSGQYRAPGADSVSQAQLGSTQGYGTGSGAIQGAGAAWATPGGNSGAPSSVTAKPYSLTSPTAAPGGTGVSNLGFGGGVSLGSNPYLSQMADAMRTQLTNNLQRNTLPMISSGAMATGGFGGSRQGVVEANALNDTQNALASGLANLYSNGYTADQNYNLGLGSLQNQAQSNLNNYNLGMNQNALGYANLDANINQNNVNNQLAGAQFGLGLYQQGLNNSQTGINAGTTLQNTPYNYYSNFSNIANGIGQGYGTSSGTSSASGNPLVGAVGGAQLYNAWNNAGNANAASSSGLSYNPSLGNYGFSYPNNGVGVGPFY